MYGASGAVGTCAVQLAAHHLDADVTGVCSAANLEPMRSLGAGQALDHTAAGFDIGVGLYDVVFGAVGKLDPSGAKRAPRQTGVYLNVLKDSHGAQRMDEFLALKDLAEAGKTRLVIDRSYRLEQIVEAHRYVDTGHKSGNVVVEVG